MSQIARLHRAYVGPTKLFMLAHRSQMTLGQRQFAHRAFVGTTCWLNVGPMGLIYWAYVGPLLAFSIGTTTISLLAFSDTFTLAQCKNSLYLRWAAVGIQHRVYDDFFVGSLSYINGPM
jgi:hypothetical protein